MFSQEFLDSQERRIRRRIKATEFAVKSGRIDSKFKNEKILPAQQLALSQIKTGKYGICIECGNTIDIDRLRHIPAALRCVSCQEKSES